MTTLFSLLTACTNGEPYIDEWFDSLMTQTYRPLEVIFWDDLSTDKTWELVKSKVRKARRNDIFIHMRKHKKKLYYGGALRAAAEEAHGTHFGIFDADDILPSYAVQHMMDLYKKFPMVGYIWSQFQTCDCQMRPLKLGFSKKPDKGESILSMGLNHKEHVYSHFRTLSRAVKEYISIFPKRGKYAVDQYMGMKLEEKAMGMFTNRVCYHYRSGCENTISATFGSQRRAYWFKLMQTFADQRAADGKKALPIIVDPTDWSKGK